MWPTSKVGTDLDGLRTSSEREPAGNVPEGWNVGGGEVGWTGKVSIACQVVNRFLMKSFHLIFPEVWEGKSAQLKGPRGATPCVKT